MRTTVEYDFIDEYQRRAHDKIDRTLGDGAALAQGAIQERAAIDTGRFRASISLMRVGKMLWIVYSVIEYGPYLEHGTRFMAAQPAFRPGYEATYQTIIRMLQQELANL